MSEFNASIGEMFSDMLAISLGLSEKRCSFVTVPQPNGNKGVLIALDLKQLPQEMNDLVQQLEVVIDREMEETVNEQETSSQGLCST